MKSMESDLLDEVRMQSAAALVSTVFKFLEQNRFTDAAILKIAKAQVRKETASGQVDFRQFMRDYEEMGMVLSTW